jgi:hypothetical protein
MSRNLPGQDTPALQWLEARIAGWVANPGAIGLTSAAVTSLATDVINARTAFTSVQSIRGDAQNATQNYKDKAKTMRGNASPIIANIKNFADNAPVPQTVYDAANVSPKSPAVPAPPPSMPINIKRVVEPDGSVTLRWDATGPVGTIYNVTRKLTGETSFTFVGQGDGSDKSFNDATVPPGTTTATFLIQGVRGPTTGPLSNPIVVFFGTADGAGAGAAAA